MHPAGPRPGNRGRGHPGAVLAGLIRIMARRRTIQLTKGLLGLVLSILVVLVASVLLTVEQLVLELSTVVGLVAGVLLA